MRVPYRAEEPDELDLYLGETVSVLQTTADGAYRVTFTITNLISSALSIDYLFSDT